MCQNVEYHTTLSRIGENYMVIENKTALTVTYASSKVKIEEEHTLMGVNAIISATGGSLGLFLGLSCYGVAWNILETIETALSSIIASWRIRKAKARDGEAKVSPDCV